MEGTSEQRGWRGWGGKAALAVGGMLVGGVLVGTLTANAANTIGTASQAGAYGARNPNGAYGALTEAQLGAYGKLAFDALKSLRYNKLTINLDGALDGEFVAGIELDGIARDAAMTSVGTGGGITVRSDVAEEWAESEWKAERLLRVFDPSDPL